MYVIDRMCEIVVLEITKFLIIYTEVETRLLSGWGKTLVCG